MLFKREVPPGQEPEGPWCGVLEDDKVSGLCIVDATVLTPRQDVTW